MAEFGTPETWNMKVGNFIESELPKEKPQELLDLQEQNRKQRLLQSLQKIGPRLEDSSLDFINRENFKVGSMAQLQTPGVIKTRELIELFEKYGIKVGDKVGNASRLAGVYGVKRPKEVKVQYRGQSPTTIKNPTQFYIKPTDSQLKQIKKQYDINQLKRTEGGPGKIAFDKRNKRAKELLKTGKYTIGQANEKLKSEFPEIKKTGMQSTLSKLAKNIKGIPSGTTGDTSASIIKIKKDLEKLNKSEVKDLLKAGNKNLQSLVNKTSKILGRDKSLSTRRIGQLIEAYRGDDRYIKVKDDLLVRRVQPLIKGLGKIEDTKLFGGIGGGLQRMAAEGEAAKSIGKTRSFFSSLRKRIQEALPKSGYETDEIKNIRSSARFGTGPYSMFVQGIKANINQEKAKALDKQTTIYEKKLQAAKPEDKPKIAEEYNTKARKFAAEANKNLKPGQPPVRVLEISFDEPNKAIKNKYALDNYGDLFDDIYQKHGYSFKVPADVKTIEEVKPFLEGGRGLKKAAQLIKAGAPRIFAIPATAYLSYQALGSSELEAAEPGVETSDDFPTGKVAAGAAAAPLATKKGRSIYGKAGKGLLKMLSSPTAAAGFGAYELGQGNIKTAGASLLAPEVLSTLAPAGKGILSRAGSILMNPFGKAARAFTPVGLATIGAGAAYDLYKEYERRKALTPEERLEEDIERDTAASEMMVGAAEGGRIGYSNGSDGTDLAIKESLEAFKRYLKAGGKLGYKDFIALGNEGVSKFFNSGGRVGFADGPDDPKRRTFMKVMAGIASLPILGKFFKPAVPLVKKLSNTTTKMPDWFPNFVDRFINKGIGNKIDADLTEYSVKELPDVKLLKQDNGAIRVEGKNAYNEEYYIDYEPPGVEVVDYNTGKTVKTKGDFVATDTEYRMISPEDYDVDGVNVDEIDDILGGSSTDLEGFAKGTGKTKYTTGQRRIDEADARGASKDESLRADINDPYGDIDPTDFADD